MDKTEIQSAITQFSGGDLTAAALNLFSRLGYDTNRSNPLAEKSFDYLKNNFTLPDNFNAEKARVEEWNYVDILFQLSDAEISTQNDLWDNKQVDNTIINSYLFVVIGLKASAYKRSCLAQICREVNKIFPMPVMLVFRYGEAQGERVTLSVIDRRINKQRGDKDVLEKVTLIKDISAANPHRAHIDILSGLSLEELRHNHTISNWVELHTAWRKTLDTKELNNRFYKDLYNWYEWAAMLARFPAGGGEQETRKSLIRLITRLIFVWFIKQKGLIPDSIFRVEPLQNLLHNFDPLDAEGGNYYNAVIQNLFFATLNREIKERGFAEDTKKQHNEQYMIKFYFRDDSKKTFFKIAHDEFVKLFNGVPFLNGGLFECLDYLKDSRPIGVDGFSREPSLRAVVPNILFFGNGKTEQGIINIFNRYVFTIEENTPIEQDIALDPELLGKVFENLLATYNPETQESARNETGSFYTPREIVEYMVDTSLKEYFKSVLTTENTELHGETKENIIDTPCNSVPSVVDKKLDALIRYSDKPLGFDDAETETLIAAIDNCKILDPACGSGAFPMGVLHKLVYILGKLDPGNEIWRELQKAKAQVQINEALDIKEKKARIKKLDEIDEVFQNNIEDYGRKLYLIENCIYGVDIQTIAVQICKLRFFISLVVEQEVDAAKENLGMRPLPNLETKFVAANTLIGFAKKNSGLSDPRIEETQSLLANVRHRHFLTKNVEEKNTLRAEDKHLRTLLSAILREDGFMNSADAEKCAAWDPYSQTAPADFFDAYWMFGVRDGFDVVIGNPPYVFTRKVDFSDDFKKYIETAYFSQINMIRAKKTKSNQSGKINLFAIFVLKGIMLNKKDGILSYILPNNLLRTTSYDVIRKYILDNTKILQIIDLGSGIFQNVTASTIVIELARSEYKEQSVKSITDIKSLERRNFKIIDVSQNQFKNNVSYAFNIYADSSKSELINKISFNKTLLGDYCKDIIEGIVAKKELIFNETKKGCFPLIEGKCIKKYHLFDAKKFILWDINKIHRSRPDYLWQLDEKILIQRISGGEKPLVAAIDYNKNRTFASVNNLVLKDEFKQYYKTLLCLLNSSVLNWYYANNFSNNSNLTVNISKTYLEMLPIVSLKSINKNKLENLADKILAAKAADPQADTQALEREIDALVYRLYDLTEEEIAVVEGKK